MSILESKIKKLAEPYLQDFAKDQEKKMRENADKLVEIMQEFRENLKQDILKELRNEYNQSHNK